MKNQKHCVPKHTPMAIRNCYLNKLFEIKKLGSILFLQKNLCWSDFIWLQFVIPSYRSSSCLLVFSKLAFECFCHILMNLLATNWENVSWLCTERWIEFSMKMLHFGAGSLLVLLHDVEGTVSGEKMESDLLGSRWTLNNQVKPFQRGDFFRTCRRPTGGPGPFLLIAYCFISHR